MSHKLNIKNFKKIGVLLLISSLIVAGCSTKDDHTNSNVKKEIKTMSLEDFTKNINNSEYQYIDTRNDEAFNGFKVDNIKNGKTLFNIVHHLSIKSIKIKKINSLVIR